jgi:hypothetical protein
LDHHGNIPPQIRQQQIASAFEYACSYGHAEVVEILLTKGIVPDWQNSGGRTGLHCAAFGAHVNVINLLLRQGASVNVKENAFRATALDVALWTWNHAADLREQCYSVIASLARAGAKLDREHWRDPEGDADGMLEAIDGDPRVLAALRGEPIDIDNTGSRV